jgi:hypothetical protein
VAEGFEDYGDLVPEGAMAIFGFRVVSYFDVDGSPGMSWERTGEQVTAGRALGDIIGAAFEMFHRHLHDEAAE